MATKNEKPKLMVENISCVIPQTDLLGGLFVGNTYGAQNPDILKQYGIRAVLTTSIQTPLNYDPVAIPFHLRIQAHDKEDYSIMEHLQECMNFIHKYRQVTNVYVHCYAGVSRSVTVVVAYLMKYWKWNLKTALQFVQAKRIVAKPNDGFMEQLKKFQKVNNLSRPSSLIPQSNQTPQQLPFGGYPVRHHSAFIQGINHNNTNPLNNTQSNIPKVLHNTPNNMNNPSSYIQGPGTISSVRKPQTYPHNNNNNSIIKKHSQTPIPKILTNKMGQRKQQKYSTNVSPNFSPNVHTKGMISGSSQIKYISPVQHPSNSNSTTLTNNINNNSSIQNVKSAKSLIRPKDLPGYRH